MKYAHKIIVIFIFTAIFYFIGEAACLGQPISSVDLINNAKKYDGQVIEYSGEVIGDVMTRGEYAWVNVNDGKNAIGIWVPKELTRDILYTGCYQAKGDWVQIKGVFNRSCAEHGGDFDIHAQSFLKVASGENISHPLGTRSVILAGSLFFLLLIVLLLKYRYLWSTIKT